MPRRCWMRRLGRSRAEQPACFVPICAYRKNKRAMHFWSERCERLRFQAPATRCMWRKESRPVFPCSTLIVVPSDSLQSSEIRSIVEILERATSPRPDPERDEEHRADCGADRDPATQAGGNLNVSAGNSVSGAGSLTATQAVGIQGGLCVSSSVSGGFGLVKGPVVQHGEQDVASTSGQRDERLVVTLALLDLARVVGA